ncbi:S-adenosylmethionine:tRNA ribosyltransferase-isomerase [hydrothermal vent metagenome]|uniref:S-adenosylmethionine:tRNA ribosyltransferase-isomerase n=1 Tax=hydrothermal vent metagenome TaxID=652676 RepID=A0A3B0S941_9ZZZZ
MLVTDFDFVLPEDRIALRPVVPRDSARLLQVAADGALSDHRVAELAGLLRAGDVLVLNDTKVFAACLQGQRAARAHGGGGPASISVNLHKQMDDAVWKAFIRPGRRLRVGDMVQFANGLSAEVLQKATGGEFTLGFNHFGAALLALFQQVGEMPLPPYIGAKRDVDAQDAQDYQTIFAKPSGSVAAPTAGLHFTDQLFSALMAKGVQVCFVTLHVGAGTFLPVKVEQTADHVMHAEWRQIPKQTARMINLAKEQGRRVIAVGTTSLRSLESAADPSGQLAASVGETDIFITPGYRFKLVDGLLTNFHLPKSTLFMLVSAFCGLPEMQNAYAHAIEDEYRFYSYGDANLLWRAGE